MAVAELAQAFFLTLGLACFLFGVAQSLMMRPGAFQYASTGLCMAVGGAMLPSLPGLIQPLADAFEGAATGKSPAPEPEPVPGPAEPSGTDADVSSWFDAVNPTVVLIALLGALVAIAMGVAGTYAAKAVTRRRAEAARMAEAWTKAAAIHNGVKDQWAEYRTDFDAKMAQPRLSDINEPAVAGFILALGRADDLATSTTARTDDTTAAYDKAAREAATAWSAARRVTVAPKPTISKSTTAAAPDAAKSVPGRSAARELLARQYKSSVLSRGRHIKDRTTS